MEHLVPIGQFAALTRLSLKALRLYDEIGLLPPARIDPDTGYRYYRLEQAERARLIRLLRAAEMPLAGIAGFLEEPTPERLDAYAAALAARQAERERVIHYLRRVLDPKEEPMSFEVRVKDVAEQPYVSRAATVSIGELEPFIVGTIRELSAGVALSGPPFTLYHGEVNDETEGTVEVCVPTAEPAPDGGVLPAGAVAYTVAVGPQTDYPEILSADDTVAVWAKQHGHELAGPPREIYLFDPSAGEAPRMEIAWPLG